MTNFLQHAFSRFISIFIHCKIKFFKNILTRILIRIYHIDYSTAVNPNLSSYSSFHDFFIRELKPDARPMSTDPIDIASPADGGICQIAAIENDTLIQAKGKYFNLSTLLANSEENVKSFINGNFTTIYLSPKDYHRVHMPIDGELTQMIHVPGDLFSVNAHSMSQTDNLFARNERVICLFNTAIGPVAVIMVGAMLVASINTSWAGLVNLPRKKEVRHWHYSKEQNNQVMLKKGDDMGYFSFGSTVILLFPKDTVYWLNDLKANDNILMGQTLGKCVK